MQKHLEKFKVIFSKYAAVAILFAIPLYPKFPYLKIANTYVSIRLEDFLILFVLLFWMLVNLKRIYLILKEPIVKAILIFLAVSLVSLLSAILITKTVDVHIGILHWLRRFEYFSALLIGLTAVKKAKDAKFYLKCILITIFILFIYGLGQKYFFWPIITTQNLEYSKGIALRYTPGAHINSTFAGHYDLATYIVLMMPVLFTLFFTVKDNIKKIIVFIVIAMGYWLLLNAISRISIISFVFGVSLSLVLIRKFKFVPLFIFMTFIVSFFSTDLHNRYSSIIVAVKDIIKIQNKIYFNYISPKFIFAADNPIYPIRNLDIQQPVAQSVPVIEDRSTSIRLNVEWPRAIRALSKNPILGTGFSSITLATDNDFLRLFGEVGAVGFIAFILILINIFKLLTKAINTDKDLNFDKALVAGIFGGFSAILINAVFIDIFEASKFAVIFWLMIGITISMVNNNKNVQNNT